MPLRIIKDFTNPKTERQLRAIMGEITVKKSYKGGSVSVHVSLKSYGFGGDSVTVKGATALSSAQARDLAASLLAEADRADAKVAAKTAADLRRKRWQDREVASGRMRVVKL